MRFVILSGAYINAGDFLIVDRTIKLLKNEFKDCEIIKLNRNEDLSSHLDEINKSDALIIAGGPAYTIDMYPSVINLTDNLDDIKTKILTIGVGWYGKNTSSEFLYKYKFSNKTKKLLERIVKDSKNLSCRDFYSVKSLFINGFRDTIMTGCPAWYNLDHIDELQIRNGWNRDFSKICISDPAVKNNFKIAVDLVKYLKDKYKNSKIYFVFHRIEKNDKKYRPLINELKKLNVEIVDITGSCDGFRIYDDCDLHIGFRVHAHIYNLSNRNVSVLIEEDGRGAGVNEALGLEGIKAYIPKNNSTYKTNKISKCIRIFERIFLRKGNYVLNKYVIQDIDNYLNALDKNSYCQFNGAFHNMNTYYKNMKLHIEKNLKEKK